jgi:hypothetical protein
MKSSLLMDILACNLSKVSWRFGEIYRLHLQTLFPAGFTLVSCLNFFKPDDGGDIFLRNVGWLSVVYMALYPRRQNSSKPLLLEPQILRAVLIFTALVIQPKAGWHMSSGLYPVHHADKQNAIPYVQCSRNVAESHLQTTDLLLPFRSLHQAISWDAYEVS